MQRAAVVGVVPTLIAVTIGGPRAAVMVHMLLMMIVGGNSSGKGLRACQRRRHYTRKLGGQK
jgi:hypothetical protein